MIERTRQRQKRRWSKAELGRRSRLHPARVGQTESGPAIPYDVELGRLAEALSWRGDPRGLLKEVSGE